MAGTAGNVSVSKVAKAVSVHLAFPEKKSQICLSYYFPASHELSELGHMLRF